MNKLREVTYNAVIQTINDFNEEYPNTENYDGGWVNKGNYKYSILYKNKKYPPKKILSRATNIETNKFSGGVQTNRVLENLGFKIIENHPEENYKKYLEHYEYKGYFSFTRQEELKLKCNAPKDKGGVYLIYKLERSKEILIYIGSSGQRDKEGNLKVRQGGLYDRLVNGNHPKFKGSESSVRKKAFPREMKNEGIEKIVVYWYVTHCQDNVDFPTDVEKDLTDKYFEKHDKLPDWHKQ